VRLLDSLSEEDTGVGILALFLPALVLAGSGSEKRQVII
jgi:hypothetical protein